MDKQPVPDIERIPDPFDETYFSRGPYAEVSFEKYSQYWWSNRFYAQLARKHGPHSGRVLEVGCGLGHLLSLMGETYQVYGTDINSWALKIARGNVPSGQFAVMSAEDLGAFPQSGFSIVIAKHVVEHLPHPERAIIEMGRVLAPGGLLVLATPNLDSLMRRVKQERWVGFKDPTHISLKPPAEWLSLIQGAGLRIRKVFSDGFWDAPYMPVLPARLQKFIFGAPGGLQAVLGWSILPLQLGESLIVLAVKR